MQEKSRIEALQQQWFERSRLGKKVLSQSLNNHTLLRFTIDQAPGIYLVTVETENSIRMIRMVKQ